MNALKIRAVERETLKGVKGMEIANTSGEEELFGNRE